uniref:Uncharacterized protein n=1 Tax=Oryza punctata TaxID=4537 RepID=A0A0E0KXM6_ORYPU
MEAAEGGAREVQVMNKTKSLKENKSVAGGAVRKEQVMKTKSLKKSPPPSSPEQVKMPCRSYSAENIKQRLTKTVKEHRARFYIIRRCIQMLICWRDEY